jgi:glucose/arabinose dehydrogenase
MRLRGASLLLLAALPLGACGRDVAPAASTAGSAPVRDLTPANPAGWSAPVSADDSTTPPFAVAEVATFDEPWAMAFLPDGRMLVTEKKGTLQLVDVGGAKTAITGVPAVAYGGQGGLGDIALHPDFANNHLVYLSYAEAGDGGLRGAAVARATLVEDGAGAHLTGLQVIWRQQPKVDGDGQYGQRILFGADGTLWISSGERQKLEPAQDMSGNLGKVLRLDDDGRPAAGNPFADRGGVAAQVWTLGHRNPLGLAFDASGRLWELEMGPQGGDELNVLVRGDNYGWPRVSEGEHYDGRKIPNHASAPKYHAPALAWTPVIAPGDFIIYSGRQFPQWRGQALVAGLKSEALIRVQLDGDHAREAARYPMGKRLREVEQAPDGALMLLEDGEGARMLKLSNPPRS